MVVMHELSGSGGSLTRVIIPGTTSEKCLDTNVDIKDDFPTPSEFEKRGKNKMSNKDARDLTCAYILDPRWITAKSHHLDKGNTPIESLEIAIKDGPVQLFDLASLQLTKEVYSS